MKVPTQEWLNLYMRAIGLLIAGMIIGSAFFMMAYQHNFHILYMENQKLLTANQQMRKELEPFIHKQKNQTIVRQIKIHIQPKNSANSLDEVTVAELQRRLQNDLELLRGRSIESAADSLMVIRGIIRSKIYPLPDDKKFKLEISLVILKNSELLVWSEAHPYIDVD